MTDTAARPGGSCGGGSGGQAASHHFLKPHSVPPSHSTCSSPHWANINEHTLGSRLCAEPGDIATHRTALFPDKETCAVVSVVRRVTRQGWGSSEKGAWELGLEHRRPESCGGRGLPEGPARVTPPRGRKSSRSLLGKAVGALRPPGVAPVLEGSLGLLWAGQTPRCGAAGTGIRVKVLGSGR